MRKVFFVLCLALLSVHLIWRETNGVNSIYSSLSSSSLSSFSLSSLSALSSSPWSLESSTTTTTIGRTIDGTATARTTQETAIQLAPYDEEGSVDLSILPQELPGYTGFARSVTTLVDYFRITGFSNSHAATEGEDWSVQLECTHEACKNGGSLFFVRAYGRAILPGKVVDHENGKYTVTILPHDAGRYTLEVVLTFSKRPNWNELPLTHTDLEPSYEGYLVKGFPLHFTVLAKQEAKHEEQEETPSSSESSNSSSTSSSNPRQRQLPVCSARQITETSTDSALRTGRWLVVNKTRSMQWLPQKQAILTINESKSLIKDIETYRHGFSSVGFQMDYFPLDCSIFPFPHFYNAENWYRVMNNTLNPALRRHPIHFLFVGDSNIRKQKTMFEDKIARPMGYLDRLLKVSHVEMIGPFGIVFPKAIARLQEIVRFDTQSLFVIMFNHGLHDIYNVCDSVVYRQYNYTSGGSCIQEYETDVKRVIEMVQSLVPSNRTGLMVWQSTTAAWPKWGVYGVQWPFDQGQKFPKVTDTCGLYNELAWPILKNEKIPVIDAYWLTLSRPDNRDVDTVHGKSVHANFEIYSLLLRKFILMVWEALETGLLNI